MRRKGAVGECASDVWQGSSTAGEDDGVFAAPAVAGYADGMELSALVRNSVRKEVILGQATENRSAWRKGMNAEAARRP